MKKVLSAVFVFFFATFLLFTSVSIAPAAEAGPFYVGVFGGLVLPDDLELERSGRSFDASMDNSWMLGAKFGYICPRVKWLAAELEFDYLADQDLDQSVSGATFSANNLMANLLFRWPEGKFHPYAGFGLGWSWGALEDDEGLDESDNAFAWQLLAGVTYEITPQWSAEFTYRYFNSEYEVADGSVNMTATDHILSIGVNYHF